MSSYPIQSINLPGIPGIHGGTGTHQSRNWVVAPASVPGSANLQFGAANLQVTTLLYQLGAAVVPNWLGVAVPHGITDFTKVNIFFHPLPAQAGYLDSQYQAKAGLWPQLFYYMERLGYQLDGADRNQIIIMPFLTEAATDTGIFLTNWLDIVTDILTDVRTKMGADDGSTLSVSQVVVSSFSVGIVYSSNFRQSGTNLSSYLAEVWDFDGLYSSSSNLSQQLQTTSQYTAIKYDQNPGAGMSSYHVPLPRWAQLVVPPTTSDQVHGFIRDFMFLHAATVSGVGAVISGGVGTAGTGGIPSGTGTAGTSTAGTGGAPSGTGTAGTGGTTSGTGGGTGGSTAGTGSTGTATAGTGGTPSGTGTAGTGGSTAGTGSTGTGSGQLGTGGTSGTGFPTPPAPMSYPGFPTPGLLPRPPTPTQFPAPVGPAFPFAPNTSPVTMPRLPGKGFPVSTSQGGMQQVPGGNGQPVTGGTVSVASTHAKGSGHHPNGCGCDCCTAIVAIVSNVATTAATATTAITAIAALANGSRKPHK